MAARKKRRCKLGVNKRTGKCLLKKRAAAKRGTKRKATKKKRAAPCKFGRVKSTGKCRKTPSRTQRSIANFLTSKHPARKLTNREKLYAWGNLTDL